MMRKKIRLSLIERHELFREGLLALLARENDVAVVGTFADGDSALRSISLTQTEVILVDISATCETSTNIVRDLIKENPNAYLIALANHCSESCIRNTLSLGVAGYALKHDSHVELMAGIRNVMQGKKYLSPSIADFVVSAYVDQNASCSDRRVVTPDRRSTRRDRRLASNVPCNATSLTDRERQIITLVAGGSKNKVIARMLSISPKTVEKHRANLMKKLDCHSVSQLIIYALENGLLLTNAAGQVEVERVALN